MKFFYGKKPKIVRLFSEFGRIAYITKRDEINKQITDKAYKAIMVGYADNHRIDRYKFHDTQTNRVITTRDVKWVEWKINDPEETLKMFQDMHKEYLVPGIEENNIPTSEPEDKMPVHIILDEE